MNELYNAFKTRDLVELWKTGCYGDNEQCSKYINEALDLYEELLLSKKENPELYQKLFDSEWGWTGIILMRELKRLRNK